MNILIVEDELISREKMRKILSPFGDCELAMNGAEALEKVQVALEAGAPYHLISLDIGLPDMPGIEVLVEVRHLENQAGMTQSKILMVTAAQDKDSVITSIQAGCNDYVIKPFDKHTVLNKLVDLDLSFLG